tara:strand:- start:580 stop:1038 length:459 start_codon:yes stop_codon:yes gene_type:complete
MSKSINWLSLPDALWCKIFEYDETYHKVYKNLLSEFVEKTMFWRLKWLNKEEILVRSIGGPTKFESKREKLQYLIDYWNTDYPDYYNLLPERNDHNCEDEFITDNYKCSTKIFNNLKLLKGYLWNKEEKKLYKPHHKQRLKYSWRGRHLVMD